MNNPFTAHPNAAGQGYWQHLGFGLMTAARTVAIALIALVHAILPFLFTTAAGDRLIVLADEIKAARAKH
jgi:hypothetical protein